MNDAFSIRAAARENPTAPFVVTPHTELTFADMAGRTEVRLSALRREGVQPNQTRPYPFVAPDDLETLVTLLASFELGVPAMPLHPRWSESERRHAVDNAAPARQHSGDSERILAVVHTSGSSGEARGVLLSRRAFLASATASAQNLGWKPEDRWLLCLPLCHIAGLSVVTRCLAARRPIAFGTAVDLGPMHATLASFVPTQLHRLLESGEPCPSHVRAVLVGGAALAPALHERALAAGYPILTTYGSTETCSQITTQTPGTRDTTHAGPPLPNVEVRVVSGRIEVRGPILASGFYPDEPLPLDDDGWFSTPDCGELTPNGELRLLGRLDDVIISGGENIHPYEVEAALVAHPAISAACVVGLPDAEFGQRVFALLVTRNDGVPPDLDAHLRQRLAGFKMPRGFLRLSALPLGPTGKVDRRAALDLAVHGASD